MSDIRKLLLVTILITFALDFLLTPLGGLETRNPGAVRIAGSLHSHSSSWASA